MTKLEIVTLTESHLEDAAHLVSRRYAALREQAPDLPSRYGDCDILLPMLQDLIEAGPGVAALSGCDLVGFLAAFPIPGCRGLPAVISPEWGNGARLVDSSHIYEARPQEECARLLADREYAVWFALPEEPAGAPGHVRRHTGCLSAPRAGEQERQHNHTR